MPLSTTKIDLNRSSAGVTLPQSVAAEVLQGVTESSAVMQLSRRMTIPGPGVALDVITGDPEAEWATVETAEQKVDDPKVDNKKMIPFTLSVIVPFSKQFKRDKSTLYEAIVERIPSALGRKYDKTVFHGTAPGTGFDVLASCTAVDIQKNSYDSLVTAKSNIAMAGGEANGFVFAPQAEPVLLGAKDQNGRPIFIDNAATQGSVSSILGVSALKRQAAYKKGSSAANVIGIVGDWNQAVTGMVNDVTVEISTEATINDGTNQINLWQRGMFAVLASIEVGFVVTDTDYFNRLTDTYSG